MKKDVIDEMFDRVKQILGEKFGGEVSILLENEEKAMRKKYGGESHFVGSYKRRETEEAKKKVLLRISQGVSVQQASKEAGVCQDTIYRFLRKRPVNSTQKNVVL